MNNPFNNNPFPIPTANNNNNGNNYTASYATNDTASALPSFLSKRGAPPAKPPNPKSIDAPSRPPGAIEYTPRLDFSQLPSPAVSRYQHLNKITGETQQEILNNANAAFQSANVDEKESIAYFIYKCKNSGIYVVPYF